ncbi:MAG: PKD domain-containing protein [Candidatus Aenigmarchaeota archaeon]|nr:PKD domain-containing protein [Candidatus Aenigmarchaeota archaeon]
MKNIICSLAVMAVLFVLIISPVQAFERPTAVLSASPTTVCKGESVRFFGGSSYDPDGYVRQYRYEYGDGETSDWIYGLDYSSHTFDSTGTFYVKLRVMDNEGYMSDYSNTVTVRVNDCGSTGNGPEITSLYITPSNPGTFEDISCVAEFRDTNYYDLSHINFRWYRNGVIMWTHTYTASGKNGAEDSIPSHLTTSGDTLRCEAIVYDYQGNWDTETRSVTIGSGGTSDSPYADLRADQTNICVGEYVKFDGSHSYDNSGYVRQYYFDFGDNLNSAWLTDTSFTYHKYDRVGTFNARLKVKDNNYQESDWSSTLRINVMDCNGQNTCTGSCCGCGYQCDSCSTCNTCNQPTQPTTSCGVQITDFDFLASGMTGNQVWAKATVKNTGEQTESVTLYLYVDDVLEDQQSMSLNKDNSQTKKFYFYVDEAGSKNIRISAYAACGSSDESEGTMTIREGFIPTPAPEPDPLRVNIYPKRVDMSACEGGSVILELNSPDKREFYLEVTGIRDEWIEYPESVIVDGSKKAYVFLNPMEAGTYEVTITASTGDKEFSQMIYVYVSPEAGDSGSKGDILSGMFSAGAGNWLWGLLIFILIVIVIVLFVSNRRVEEQRETTYIGGDYNQPYYGQNGYRYDQYGNPYPEWYNQQRSRY